MKKCPNCGCNLIKDKMMDLEEDYGDNLKEDYSDNSMSITDTAGIKEELLNELIDTMNGSVVPKLKGIKKISIAVGSGNDVNPDEEGSDKENNDDESIKKKLMKLM